MFGANDLAWPFNDGDIAHSSYVYEGGLLPREYQCVVFFDKLWGPRPDDPVFLFLDVNPTLTRIAGAYL